MVAGRKRQTDNNGTATALRELWKNPPRTARRADPVQALRRGCCRKHGKLQTFRETRRRVGGSSAAFPALVGRGGDTLFERTADTCRGGREFRRPARISGKSAGGRQLEQLGFRPLNFDLFGTTPQNAGNVNSIRNKILSERRVYGMENNQKDETVALERYKIIGPILAAMEENADKGKIGFLKSEACGLAGVSRKTLNRWLVCYAQEGLDGLKYHAGASASKKKYPAELVTEAVLLRREIPSRSISQIIDILEMEGRAPKGYLKRATLCDRLREAGYSKAQMKLYRQPGIAARRFARTERNDMWQADIKHCGYIRYGRESKGLYFAAFIDDATRYIIHGEFYHDFDQTIVEDSLRKGINKHGLPRRLYFDNGKQFRTRWMQRACAILDIKLIFTAPYSPEAKGYVKRFVM